MKGRRNLHEKSLFFILLLGWSSVNGRAHAITNLSCLESMRAQGAIAPLSLTDTNVVSRPPPGFKPPWGFSLPKQCQISSGGLIEDKKLFLEISGYTYNGPPFSLPSKQAYDATYAFRWYPATGQAILLSLAPLSQNVTYVSGIPLTGESIGDGYTLASGQGEVWGTELGCYLNFNNESAIVDPSGIAHRFFLLLKSGPVRADLFSQCKTTRNQVRKERFEQPTTLNIGKLDDGTFFILAPNYQTMDYGTRIYIRLGADYRQHDFLNGSIYVLAGDATEEALHNAGISGSLRYQAILKLLRQNMPNVVGIAAARCPGRWCKRRNVK